MARKSCDGAGLLDAFRAAVANLEAHVDEINGLNVYPVPDGDTGSNMYATVKAALDEAEAVAGEPADRIAAAISFGALMGARGNSGVITSQIFRGMAEGLAGKRRFNGLDLAHALSQGAKTAYGAVAKPVEGTILTVIRESAVGAVEAAERDNDIEYVLGATLAAAEKSVARTPSLLAILREAGVVDSGGQGVYRLFQGALLHLAGKSPAGAVKRPAAGSGPKALDPGRPRRRGLRLRDDVPAPGRGPHAAGRRRHPRPPRIDRRERPRRRRRPGAQGPHPQRATRPGHRLRLDPRQPEPDHRREPGQPGQGRARDQGRRVHRAPRPSCPRRASPGPSRPRDGGDDQRHACRPADLPSLAVIAVTAGDGLAAVFREFGVAAVVQGGQSANPSTGELLEAVKAVQAREVLLLPNNPNVVLAARQVADLSERPVSVVPTRNAAEGFAALFALDQGLGAAANVTPMTEAGRAVQTVAVTTAVRDATIGGKKVKKGQTIALDPDDGLVAVDNDSDKCVLAAMAALTPGYELVTVFYGDGATLAEAEATAHKIGALVPGTEVEVRFGGQPFYRYLISAE